PPRSGPPPRRGPRAPGSAAPRPGTPPQQRSMRRGACCVPAGGPPAHVPAAAPAGLAPTVRCAPAPPPGRNAAPRLASRSSAAGVAPYPPPIPCPAHPCTPWNLPLDRGDTDAATIGSDGIRLDGTGSGHETLPASLLPRPG